jgi:putative ABC transport system permease protein
LGQEVKFKLILKDLLGQAEVSLAIIISVSLAVASLFFSFLFMRGVTQAIEKGFNRLGAELAVVPQGKGEALREVLLTGQPSLFYFEDISEKIREVTGVEEATPQAFVVSVPASCCTAGNVFLVAIDSESDFVVSPWVFRGEEKIAEDEVLTGFNVKRPVGLSLFFYSQRYRVAANLDQTGWGYFDNGVFLNLKAAYRMADESLQREDTRDLHLSPPQVSAIFVRVKDSPWRVKKELEKEFKGIEVVELGTLLPRLRKTFSTVSRGLLVISGLIWTVVLVLIGTLFYLLGEQRKTDMALFRAIGGTRRELFAVVVLEAALLAMVGAVIGAILGFILTRLFQQYIVVVLKVPFTTLSFSKVLLVWVGLICLSVGAGAFSSLYPAWLISQKEPYDGVRGV